MSDFQDLLKNLQEGPITADPTKAPPERRTAPEPTRRKRKNPLTPKPGTHPKPKAEHDESKGKVNQDVELFRKMRETKVNLSK